MVALANWQPRRRTAERRYQESLLRHLDAAVARGFASRERWLESGRRVDFVIADEVIAEMKRTVDSRAAADAAITQFREYTQTWSHKGPTVLVICDPHPTYARVVAESVNELRRSGFRTCCILVPPRGQRVDWFDKRSICG